jgi:hypothetical protein
LVDARLSRAIAPTIECGRVDTEGRAQQQPKERKSMTTSTMGVAARTMWPDATNALVFETEDGFTLARGA